MSVLKPPGLVGESYHSKANPPPAAHAVRLLNLYRYSKTLIPAKYQHVDICR